MDAFEVHGGARLSGTVHITGAKNSALKLAAASVLSEGRSKLTNVPEIADIPAMADILRHLGVTVTAGPGQLHFDVPARIGGETPPGLARRLRASIVLLGPLLARRGHARVAQPGGCNLGNRNIDMHLSALAQLGAEITIGADHVEARVPGGRLQGADIELPFASVGATENLLMAAVTARGTTTIRNAAREPEITDLAAYLVAMGARISAAGTTDIVVEGVEGLHPADHRVVGDRIEAGTFAVGAALTGGDVRIEGVEPSHLRLPLDKLRTIGAEVIAEDGAVVVRGGATAKATDVVTLPFPGFPTDLQPQFLVLLSQAAGTAMVTENVFDGRVQFVAELVRMGAEIAVEAHHAVVRGPRPLHGATVRATDLRAGAALVLAGLVADGPTVVTDPHHVDRGYADLAGRLRALGADVRRRSDVAAGVA
ncbi:MAG: UDP-N-acetylglucosamine 1-carboxyvinyltransferase [Euzebyales bacterium]|nr:UDP-N-acetylglucosamine 1-carboxyvinyltransferase [Euzebyales bacterium]